MDRWFSSVQSFLTHSSLAVYLVAGGILLSAAVCYWFWFRWRAVQLQASLETLAVALDAPVGGWPLAREAAEKASQKHAVVAAAWKETEARVIAVPDAIRTQFVMFGSPRDLWSADRLLSRSLNLQLAEAVPNLLVGIGLLFTFFFLTVALMQATSALVAQEGQAQADLLSATRGLLSAAGAKFLTSLAGLAASITWAVAQRRRIAKLTGVTELVIERLARFVSTDGGEILMVAQLRSSRDLHQSAMQHIDATQQAIARATDQITSTQQVVGKATEHIDLTTELLGEAREQTGTLKRFETDLAVSLAGAITKAFSPQMEAMTSRLIHAIDGLSDRLGTMNQEALQQMLVDFQGMLKQATDSEMNQLRETLTTLAKQIDGAGEAIGSKAGKAAADLDRAGAGLLEKVEAVSEHLATGATNLEAAIQGVKVAMNDLDVTVIQASNLGKQGAVFVRGALETSEGVVGKLKSASDGLSSIVNSIERTVGQLAEAADGVEELSREQHSVIAAVREAVPQAMASVQHVQQVLAQSARITGAAMNQVKETMTAATSALDATVMKMSTGVTEYSKTVADLHGKMDEHMARAIGSLDKGVVDLSESIEELGDVLGSRRSAA